MDALTRLIWALPLVLLMGLGVVLLLRRFVVPVPLQQQHRSRMKLSESLTLSDYTCAHLIEIDGRTYAVIESTRQLTFHALAAQVHELPRVSTLFRPAWLQGLGRSTWR